MQFNESFFRDLLVSAPVEDLVMTATEEVAAKARSTAPVDTGAYREKIITTKKYQKRVIGLVQATDPGSLAIEARTGNLARAVRAQGKGRRR